MKRACRAVCVSLYIFTSPLPDRESGHRSARHQVWIPVRWICAVCYFCELLLKLLYRSVAEKRVTCILVHSSLYEQAPTDCLLLHSHKMNATSAENHLSVVGSYYEALAIASGLVNNVLGLPLNACVMWLILAGAKETLASDFFSLNLAMSEIFLSLSNIWYFVFLRLKLLFWFKAFMFSRGLFYTARPLSQCCICVECYVGVVHPVLFLRFRALRYRVACCCFAWLIALVSCIYSMFTYSNPLYLYGSFIQNVLFFSVMLFCCLSVLRALKRPGPGGKATEKKKSSAVKRRAFKIILLTMIVMAINFFLYVAVIPLQCCLNPLEFTSAITISTSLALTTGFVQPLLYLHRTRKLLCFSKF